MTVSEPLFNHGLEWFRILYRTRKAKPGVRERSLGASHDGFAEASRFPLDAIRKLEAGVRRQFGRMELIGDLDWQPSFTLDDYESSLLAPKRKRSLAQQQHDEYRLKFNRYEAARLQAVEKMWIEVRPMLDAASVPERRRSLYRSVTNVCCHAALNTLPGSAAERSIVEERIFHSNLTGLDLDTELAQKVAKVVLARFHELAKSFPRPKR